MRAGRAPGNDGPARAAGPRDLFPPNMTGSPMKKTALYACLIFCLCLFRAAHAQNLIRAEGMATIHSNFVDIARDKALENAQRNAVEKAMGVMVSSSSEVENFQLKMDRILAESSGFISRYTVVSEKREGDTYRVTIEAEVGADKLKDRMTAVNLIMARKSKPRIMVVFRDDAQKDFVAEAAVASYLLSKGFKLVDTGTVRKDYSREAYQKLTADQKGIVELAQRYGGEVILLGTVETATNSFNLGGIEMHSNKAVVSAKAVNVDTGDILGSESESVSAPGMKGDVKKVTEESAGKLARKMADRIIERWSSELANAMTVKLIVTGLDTYQALMNFKERLNAEAKGIRDIHQRSYAHGRVDMDIEIRGNAQGLADDIAAMSVNKRKVKITGITQNKVEAAVVP